MPFQSSRPYKHQKTGKETAILLINVMLIRYITWIIRLMIRVMVRFIKLTQKARNKKIVEVK
jgi:hypothetical protein